MLCMRCVVCTFFLKSCTVDLSVRFTEVFQLTLRHCVLSHLQPHSSCVVHCVSCAHSKSVVASKKRERRKKNNFYRFSVRSQQNLFFQQCLLNDSSKNVYFNIYLLHDLYKVVIYNWINFICCEIKKCSVFFSLFQFLPWKMLDLKRLDLLKNRIKLYLS